MNEFPTIDSRMSGFPVIPPIDTVSAPELMRIDPSQIKSGTVKGSTQQQFSDGTNVRIIIGPL